MRLTRTNERVVTHTRPSINLQNERNKLKEAFIAKKQAAKANIKTLKNGLDALKEKDLRDLVEEYREIDSEFKSLGECVEFHWLAAWHVAKGLAQASESPRLITRVPIELLSSAGVLVEKDALMDGAKPARRTDNFDPTRANNDELLDKAADVQQSSLAKLKQGLATVETTKEQGKYTAGQLQEGREKLQRIDQGLDEVQSELELSTVLLTRFVKRIATDKVVIAFATLLVLAVVGIIVYAVMNPNQKIFNVPDVVKPALSPTASPTATPSFGHSRMLRAAADGGNHG